MAQNEIDRLVYLFSRIPGLGPRSSRRAVLHLMKYRESLMIPLADSIRNTANSIKTCQNCFNLDVLSPCTICSSPKRDQTLICVIESVADLWAIERGKIYKGLYHVLGGTLSALDNVSPDDLNIDKLLERASNSETQEIILANNATVDGQTTAFYITERLKNYKVKISQLAHGIPVGGELDYLDEGTLSAALQARKIF
ncbi:MAG: recombination mediator RecR [Alphaproteobacteria bacterium]